MTKTIAIYARSATAPNTDGIEKQIASCREHIKRAGGDPDRAQVLTETGVSLPTEQLFGAVESNKIRVVIIADWSRAGRPNDKMSETIERLRSMGAAVVAVDPGPDGVGAVYDAGTEAWFASVARRAAEAGTCDACGAETTSRNRCTNGRCLKCHARHCTPGGSTSPGHGRGTVKP